jgi:hypothetical protein
LKFKPGQSGNPAGPPRGKPHKLTAFVRKMVDDKGGAIVKKIIERAEVPQNLESGSMICVTFRSVLTLTSNVGASAARPWWIRMDGSALARRQTSKGGSSLRLRRRLESERAPLVRPRHRKINETFETETSRAVKGSEIV